MIHPEPHTSSRRERDRERRRTDILAAAEAVFAAKGYHDASVEAIAAEAGYAAGTIYLYFENKEALYMAVFAEKLEEMLAGIEERAKAASGPLAALRAAVQAQFEFHDHHRSFFDLFIREEPRAAVKSDAEKLRLRECYQRHVRLLRGLIEAAQGRGDLRKLDAEQLAVVLLGMIIQIFRNAAKQGSDAPLMAQADLVLDLFLNGAAVKGAA